MTHSAVGEMTDDLKDRIARFLDEFMRIEYHGREHIVAREHYLEVFSKLVPEFLVALPPPSEGSISQKMDL